MKVRKPLEQIVMSPADMGHVGQGNGRATRSDSFVLPEWAGIGMMKTDPVPPRPGMVMVGRATPFAPPLSH